MTTIVVYSVVGTVQNALYTFSRESSLQPHKGRYSYYSHVIDLKKKKDEVQRK